MKQFKHKILGWIATEKNHPSGIKEYSIKTGNAFGYNLLPALIENSNDWEEIIPKKQEFTILTFRNISAINKSHRWLLQTDGNYKWEGWGKNEPAISLNRILNDPNINTIDSVRRESDGEIFIVGDYFEDKPSNMKIVSIRYGQANPSIYFDGKSDSGDMYVGKPLIDARKILPKQKLFTTEDGVDIYKNDDIHMVDPTDNAYFYFHSYAENPNHSGKMWKIFSTKEKADDYILINKKLFSLNDIKGNVMYKTNSIVCDSIFSPQVKYIEVDWAETYKNLVRLAKSKP